MIEQYFEINEVAEIFRIKPQTVRRWVFRREIGSVKIGRRRLIPESEIAAKVAKGYQPAIESETNRAGDETASGR